MAYPSRLYALVISATCSYSRKPRSLGRVVVYVGHVVGTENGITTNFDGRKPTRWHDPQARGIPARHSTSRACYVEIGVDPGR